VNKLTEALRIPFLTFSPATEEVDTHVSARERWSERKRENKKEREKERQREGKGI